MDQTIQEFLKLNGQINGLCGAIDNLEDEKAYLEDKISFLLKNITDLDAPYYNGQGCQKSPVKQCVFDENSQHLDPHCVFCGRKENSLI